MTIGHLSCSDEMPMKPPVTITAARSWSVPAGTHLIDADLDRQVPGSARLICKERLPPLRCRCCLFRQRAQVLQGCQLHHLILQPAAHEPGPQRCRAIAWLSVSTR